MNKYKDLEHQMSLKKTSSTMLAKDFQEIQSIKKQLNDNLQANKMSAKSKEFMPNFPKKPTDQPESEQKKEAPKKTMRLPGQALDFQPPVAKAAQVYSPSPMDMMKQRPMY